MTRFKYFHIVIVQAPGSGVPASTSYGIGHLDNLVLNRERDRVIVGGVVTLRWTKYLDIVNIFTNVSGRSVFVFIWRKYHTSVYTIEYRSGIRRDGHLLFEVEMYLQKGCIMVSGVGSS